MAASIAVAVTVSGCLRVGIPERFGNSTSVTAATPAADGQERLSADQAALSQALGSPLLLYIDPAGAGEQPGDPDKASGASGVSSGGPKAGEPGSMLGCQYLFGLIPFTRVFLQHGIGHLLTETGIDQGIAAGRTVIVADRTSAAAAAALLAPELSIRPEVESVSLNAYDLLFFRYLKASGIIRYYFGGGGNLDHETVQLIDQSEFRAFGHAPALARVLERGVADATAAGLKQAFELSARSFRPAPGPAATASRQIVLILPPRIPQEVIAALGEQFGASYGFSGAAQFKAGQVERVIQLGLSTAAAASDLYPAAVVFPGSRNSFSAAALRRRGSVALGSAGSAWVLSAEVLSAAVAGQAKEWTVYGGSGPGMFIELQLSLYSLHGGELQLAFSKNERVYKPVVDEADGAWVVTAEDGVAELAVRFLGGQSESAALKPQE